MFEFLYDLYYTYYLLDAKKTILLCMTTEVLVISNTAYRHASVKMCVQVPRLSVEADQPCFSVGQ